MKHGVPLDGARILVTGASGGIGRALAVALAAKGARLVVAARRRTELDDLAAEIAATGRPRPQVVAIDLSAPGAADELTQAAPVLDGVDILVNNAGGSLIGAQGVVGAGEPGRRLFELNFWTPLALTAALVPQMQRTGWGAVVNVTSTMQSVPVPLVGYYSASKAALARATDALRLELTGTGVRVLEAVPGSTETPGYGQIENLPLRRFLPTPPRVRPASVARAIVRALERGNRRVVYPATSYLPLTLPIFGRLAAAVAARSIDTRSATVVNPLGAQLPGG